MNTTAPQVMPIILANPRGFCAGVERAIAIVERALEQFGAPIYVRHEVVHNKFVVEGLRQRGASHPMVGMYIMWPLGTGSPYSSVRQPSGALGADA